jgi:hypothetical protein
MLIIYSNYDPVTHVLSSYATTFVAESGHAVPQCLDPACPDQHHAVRSVMAGLRENSATKIVFFGHGRKRPPGLLAQDRQSWLDRTNCAYLAGRKLVATACFSRDGIGRRALAHGATVVGYSGVLWVPLQGPGVRLMEECILTLPRALRDDNDLRAASEDARQRFLDVARELQGMEDPEAKLVASFVRLNARAVGLADKRRIIPFLMQLFRNLVGRSGLMNAGTASR